MTRVTPPVAKLARTLAATPSLPRPHYATKTASNAAALARSELLGSENRLEDHLRRSMTTTHRPTPMPTPSASRTVPLMQGFQTSAAPAARSAPLSTMDATILPPMDAAPADSISGLRVPLLPDNFYPDRSSSILAGTHGPEATDAPLAAPVVVAADPGNVYSALTEIEGLGVDGVELNFAHGEPIMVENHGHGMIKDMWKGLVDDVFGEKKPVVA